MALFKTFYQRYYIKFTIMTYVTYLVYYLTLGQSIQEWTKWNLRKTAFKKFEVTRSA